MKTLNTQQDTPTQEAVNPKQSSESTEKDDFYANL
jgi:hypothetical protein